MNEIHIVDAGFSRRGRGLHCLSTKPNFVRPRRLKPAPTETSCEPAPSGSIELCYRLGICSYVRPESLLQWFCFYPRGARRFLLTQFQGC
jgi:hypothetical protein